MASPTLDPADPRAERGFLRLTQVLELIPVSRSAWWTGCRSGRYPKPVKLGPRTTVWYRADIEELIASAKPGPTSVEKLIRNRRWSGRPRRVVPPPGPAAE